MWQRIQLRAKEYSTRFELFLQETSTLSALPYWIAAILTGFASVGYAKAFQVIGSFCETLHGNHPLALLLVSPVCFFSGWWLVHRWAPEAAGSGIPQIMAASELDHQDDSKLVLALIGLKTSGIKVLSSLLCLLGGGAIGREGPTLQIAASIFHFTAIKGRRVWHELNHQSLIIAGGAAGIASAFNTPLGGIVYAIEELASAHFSQFRHVVIAAVILSGLVAQWIQGPYLYLGFPSVQTTTFSFFPLAILTGVITGFAGAYFGKILYRLCEKKKELSSKNLGLLAIGCGIGMALLGYFFGSHAIGSGRNVMTDLLFQDKTADWTWYVPRFLGSLISYISGCAGGIFAPSLATGAAIGSQLASLTHSSHPHLMILLGMIGFLTGVTRAPFTAFVLVLEMTDRHSAIFSMMLTAFCASIVARMVMKQSFYELMKINYLQQKESVT